MKYQIVGKNTTITDSIRAAIEKKLGRMDKYFVDGDNVLCRAVVVTYKVGAKVEITIFTKEMDFRTEVRANDFYDSEHLNGYGQKKISSYLGKLVKDKYDMQSKSLDNTQVSNWNLCADYIDSFYKYYEENRDPVRIEDGDNLPNLRESVKYMNILSNH